jgi:hypothetical protein
MTWLALSLWFLLIAGFGYSIYRFRRIEKRLDHILDRMARQDLHRGP